MELFYSLNSDYKSVGDTSHLMSVRLRIDYENSKKGDMKCEIHNSNDISFYCRQCKQGICAKCEVKHDKHDFVDRNRIVSEKIDNISSIIEKFCIIKSDIKDVIVQCDKQRSTIYTDQKISLDNINTVFSDLHQEIETLKSELLLELQQVVENCLCRLDVNKTELLALHDDVSSITELIVRENSAFQNYNLFELEEFTSQKLMHYTDSNHFQLLRPNELKIRVKWTDNIHNIVKQPLAKINCHLGLEKLSHLRTIPTKHVSDKQNSCISSICCDVNDIVYLCDSANNSIKVLKPDYSIEKCFTGTGIYKLVSPTTILCLPSSEQTKIDKSSNRCATIIVSDPASQNVVTFNQQGQGIDLFVTSGISASMCSIGDLNELENLQESSLELSPIYSSLDNYQSQEISFVQQAVVLCTKLDSLCLEFIQINPNTFKLCKSRPDLPLSCLDANNSLFPKSIVWNSFSKYLFLLDNREHKVVIFSSQDGRFIRFYGRYGSGAEEFNEPSSIVVDKEGNVLISDMLNNRVHVLDSLGNFVKFLFPFTHKRPICMPTAMCFDNNNNLIICEKDGNMKIYTY